jgi:hypothetical protein
VSNNLRKLTWRLSEAELDVKQHSLYWETLRMVKKDKKRVVGLKKRILGKI